ncbi:MAG: B12-binding domain-containing radical SAM protein, partial [Elusimicrobia bacterium]|nr:B12-binding domain-containing radical SAM protein [Elusimicrobiota bacterium]
MILINPQVQKLGKFARYVPMYVPIGLGSLAGYLISQNRKVGIIDENITPINSGLIDEYSRDTVAPYIFGVSCLTAGISRAYELAKMLKEKYPDSKIILGGIHPTVLSEEALKTGHVDIVVRREGEETLNLLYESIKRKEDYSKIQGISFNDGHGNLIHNPDARLPAMDSLPPFPYHLFEKHLGKYNFGFIATSRGCPYNCIFCSQRCISGRTYRYINPEKVIELLDLLINKYKQKYILFVDDDFTVNKNRTKKLCTLMHKNKFYLKAKFDCQTRGDSINPEILEYLKMAG